MSTAARRMILTLGGNRVVANAMTRHGLKMGAGRFVAGETLPSALEATKSLNQSGLAVTLDLLGESVHDVATASAMTASCEEIVRGMKSENLEANLSLKLTQLGLDISPELAFENMVRLQDTAHECGNFIRIDMESSALTDATLDIVTRLYQRHRNVGTVIQAYLYRSPKDLGVLAKLGMNARIVKGAYMEPASVAFPSKGETDQAFVRLVEQHLRAGCYTAIATHDDAMIAATERIVQELKVPRSQFEFQMLYGIRSARQLELVQAGYRTRVYVPFGRDWYPYFVRRLAERPANLWFITKNMFRA